MSRPLMPGATRSKLPMGARLLLSWVGAGVLGAMVATPGGATIPWFDGGGGTPRAWNGLPASADDALGAQFGWGRPSPARSLEDPRFDYDVEHYELVLSVDPDAGTVGGSVAMHLRAETDLAKVVLDMGPSLVADSVIVRGEPAVFTHEGDELSVTLPAVLEIDEREVLTVHYHGPPGPPFFPDWDVFRTHGEDPNTFGLVATLSAPDRADYWWPCKDELTDKATGTIQVSAPPGYVLAANGLRTQHVETVDGVTDTFETRYPMATYLFSITLSNFVEWSETYDSPETGLDFPIQNFVFPEDEAEARVDLATVHESMRAFEKLFGPYPFADPEIGIEKYGHAEVIWGGAMEHQTMTSLGRTFIRGDGSSAWAVAHELSHQWFGNAVTPTTWDDIWLNEG
ncbi:MAG: hypothetical protein KC729_06490, partial [Candidatus Eisenbacteria bacterium]|nr:hypothetical protein [Candidatus Eisenbacteria bacterium]